MGLGFKKKPPPPPPPPPSAKGKDALFWLVTFPACEGDKGDSPGEDESDGKGPDGEKGRLLSTQLHLLQSGWKKPGFF